MEAHRLLCFSRPPSEGFLGEVWTYQPCSRAMARESSRPSCCRAGQTQSMVSSNVVQNALIWHFVQQTAVRSFRPCRGAVPVLGRTGQMGQKKSFSPHTRARGQKVYSSVPSVPRSSSISGMSQDVAHRLRMSLNVMITGG
jgi:hypothetical protein